MSDQEQNASTRDGGGPIRVAKIHDLRSGKVDAVRRLILVDRLWPRGVAKDAVDLDDWLKDVAPSTELRTWFGHDPAKFDEFGDRYHHELDSSAAEADHTEIDRLLQAAEVATVAKPLVLVYAAKDREHNHALVLADWLRANIG
ncbi:DUF488 domain-containing protein [Corynebacterium xerosis]|uniref:DUF488 domain-containing protein n=1 Tax=Corynebacterium xerosis TaxID=1725 RepID=UPI0027B989FE|nr:DUF488 family protein [Corynebacterium xerosis]